MRDAPDTWMPLVIGDYLADTRALSTEGHGAYLLLLMTYWRTGGPLPDDDDEFAAITGLGTEGWKKWRPKLARFFTVADGVWRQKRADLELAAAARRLPPASMRLARSNRMKGASWEAIRQRILRRDGHQCVSCGSAAGPMEVDHIHPLARGGDHMDDNLQSLCRPCNRRKSHKLGAPQ